MTRSAFYFYFESKHLAVAALMEQVYDGAMVATQRFADPDLSPTDRVRGMVTTLFDTVQLAQEGVDRVRVHGVRGQAPSPSAKVAMTYDGGFATTCTLYLTGLDIEEKAAFVERALWSAVDRTSFESAEVELLRTDVADPPNNVAAMAHLRITVRDPDREKVGKRFVSRVVELGLSGGRRGVPHHEGDDGLAPFLISAADDARFAHRRMRQQRFLDLAGIDVGPARDDHVL